MEVEFQDPALDRLEIDDSFHGGYSSAIVRGYRKCLQSIRAAVDERDLYAAKGLHYEKLKGSMSGLRSMRINKQMRLILRVEEKEASRKKVVVIRITDYH